MAAAAPPAAAGGLFAAAVRWHRNRLQSAPLLTNAVTSGVLMAIGDRAAQRLERGDRPLEDGPERAASWRRTAVLTTWSLCLSAPFWTSYYSWVAKAFPGRQLLWIGITAAISAPFNSAFLSYSTAATHLLEHPAPLGAEGRAVLRGAVVGKLEDKLWPTLLASVKLWPPVNYVTFYYVPLEYRQLFTSGFALAWNIYLSLAHGGKGIAGGAAPPPPAAAAAAAEPPSASVLSSSSALALQGQPGAPAGGAAGGAAPPAGAEAPPLEAPARVER